MFLRSEPGDRVADRMQRCAAVTSVQDLLLEVEDVLEYLKSHDGVVDESINDDEQIVEDAMGMQIDGDANSTPAVRTAPDMRGGIPSANTIDTLTVAATPAMRLRMAQNILPNDSATKRTHNTTVPPGHTIHPSKVQKQNPQANLNTNSNSAAPTQNTFTEMSAQGAYVHTTSSYITDPPMDMSNPFAPIGQSVVGYNVMRDDNSSSDNASRNNSRWNSRLQVRNNGKGKSKPFKKGKRDPSDPYWNIPEFGKASGM
jgi:hypothetical protein